MDKVQGRMHCCRPYIVYMQVKCQPFKLIKYLIYMQILYLFKLYTFVYFGAIKDEFAPCSGKRQNVGASKEGEELGGVRSSGRNLQARFQRLQMLVHFIGRAVAVA